MKDNPWIKDFPQLKQTYHYFDSAATSLKPKQVIDKVNDYLSRLSANIHRGMYHQSQEATELYEASREVVCDFVHAWESEVVFTRGTTASLNLVAMSYGLNNLKTGDIILTTELEHHSSILPWQNVAKKTGAIIKYIPLTDTGKVTVESFKKVMNNQVKVVAIHHISNVLGYIAPVQEITKIAHEFDAIVVCDGAQAIQHMTVDVKALDVDFYAFSGHKMLGPTGIGVLYGKYQLLDQMEPIEFGGDMALDVFKGDFTWKDTPIKFEAGTMPIAEAIGLSEAINYLNEVSFDAIHDYVEPLYQYLMSELNKIEDIAIYNQASEAFIFTFNIKGVPAHDAITYFAEKDIALRAGQHCAKLVHDFLGIQSSLRGTIYFYNTEEEIQLFIKVLKDAIEYFRSLGFIGD